MELGHRNAEPARQTGDDPPPPFHAMPVGDLLAAFGTDVANGLSGEVVERLRSRYGYNELAPPRPGSRWKVLARQFNQLIVWILICAAIVSGVLGDRLDAMAILAIVGLNGVLGFVQEERAGQALAALKSLSAPRATVLRNGALRSLPARELVPGDRIVLDAGDFVPADARLINSSGFRVQEASLTGESAPVDKAADDSLPPATALADRVNMAYVGTSVTAGKADAVVVAIGMATELGRIAGMLAEAQPQPTPLQRRLSELGRTLFLVVLGVVAVIFGLQMLRGGRLVDAFLLSVSLAVAAVPEGLPAVVTIALALGLQRMVRRNALVRRLPSVETLGSVTVICSDKTGTLTRNEMTVREILAGGVFYDVTGSGYAPKGDFLKQPEGKAVPPGAEPDLVRLLTIAAWCSHARLNPTESDDRWQLVGDPTEGALVVAAMKAGIATANADRTLMFEIPFDSQRKRMSVVARWPYRNVAICTKGAPESVLALCDAELRSGTVHALSDPRRREILDDAGGMARRALRVLALAYREGPPHSDGRYLESGLVFAGLAGMIDPPRDEAKAAVTRCHHAGIRPVMITGDHPATAAAIAGQLGIAREQSRVVAGPELEGLSDQQLAASVDRIAVYARVSPEHKLRVVRAWKARGHVVAMTGDGVNDAPAVKAADIGIAMGISGTDVTKEASDMVLTDDNFASIVAAVEEGRGIFDNIQKVVHYLLACNAGEILFMLFAALVGWPPPLLAIHLLWINLVTDGLPALALGVEPPEPDVMGRPPRPPREPVITLRRGLVMLLHGSLVAAAAAVAFALAYRQDAARLGHARTIAFCTLAFTQLFYSFACRSWRYTLPQLRPLSNPHLCAAIAVSALLQLTAVLLPAGKPLFKVTSDLSRGEWLLVLALSLTPATVVELVKLLRAWRRGAGAGAIT